jgi:hypothetical protein
MIMPIIWSSAIALVAGVCLVAISVKFPRAFSYTIAALTVSAPGMVGGFYFGHNYNWALVVLIALTLVLFGIFTYHRRRLGVMSDICVGVRTLTAQNTPMILTHIALSAAAAVVLVVLAGLLLFTWLVREVVKDAEGTPMLRVSPLVTGYSVVWAIFFVWFVAWVVELRRIFLADVVSNWYWHGREKPSVACSLKHTLCAHSGSAAAAGIAAWIGPPIRGAGRVLHTHGARSGLEHVGRWVLVRTEHLIALGTYMVGIMGKPYEQAGQETGQVLWSASGHTLYQSGIWLFPQRVRPLR